MNRITQNSEPNAGEAVVMTDPVLEVEGLSHRLYDPERKAEFVVTVPIRLAFPPASFVTILGPNACGKSTLLTVLGLLRRPTSLDAIKRFYMRVPEGNGVRNLNMVEEWRKGNRIEELRRRYLGFALQSGELLSALTVRENIAVPLRVNGVSSAACRGRVDELLHDFGLLKGSNASELPNSRVNTISGGEYQRVALARAIVHRPTLVFVDEPTANLNRTTARQALTELRRLQKESRSRTTVVMITHDDTLAKEFADLIVQMESQGVNSGTVAGVTTNTPRPTANEEGEGT